MTRGHGLLNLDLRRVERDCHALAHRKVIRIPEVL